MAKGGARKGAGRKKGAASLKSREIADKAAAEGITPLEVMLKAMRHLDALADEQQDRNEKSKLLIAAADIAKDAAPFIHPRLAQVAHTDKDGNGLFKDIADVLREVSGRTAGLE
jgi:hypothetical protein